MTERRIRIGAAVGVAVGLSMVWYLVNSLWVQGWSMHLIHVVAILAAALVTMAASVIVVAVVIRYRRVLEEKNRELERLAAIGEIVARVAHYQKNLLNGLRGGLYVTNGAMAQGDWEKLRDGWRMLHGSVQRIERLTLDMLYYVKGRIPQREPTDVNELIQEVLELMRATAAQRNVELRANLGEGIGNQTLDRAAIHRAILDLVSNAIDACAESESGNLVSVESRATENEVVLTVADNGVGMSDGVRSQLFVRFFSTKGGQGTGLGLPVVKKVVEEHGGALEVESKLGRGSAFHLRFPKTGRSIAALMGAALSLAGCQGFSTSGERAAREQVAAVARLYRPRGQQPTLPALSQQSTLADFLRHAMLGNPQVEAAYFDWLASLERITTGRSLPDPRLTFESDIADVVITVMPGLMQEFPGPGKLKAAAKVATAESKARYYAFETSVLQTASSLKRAYYQLWFLDANIRINRQTLRLLVELEEIARAQNAAAKVTLQDVYRAQIEEDQLTTEIANLEDSRRPLIAQLKGALGLGRGQADPPGPTQFEPTPLDLHGDQLLDTAFARNPRLKTMEADVRMAEAAIALARKSKVPDYGLGLMVDARAYPVVFRPLVTATLPIWRDKIAAQIAQAQAAKRAAEARLTSEQIMVTVDFAMKSYEYREITRNLALLQDKLIPKARQSLEIARAGYLAGEIDFFNLIDAERTLLNFQLQQVGARTRRELVLTDLSLSIAGIVPEGAPIPPPGQPAASK